MFGQTIELNRVSIIQNEYLFGDQLKSRVVQTLFLLIGTTCNLTAFYVFKFGKFEKLSAFYLSFMSIVDTLALYASYILTYHSKSSLCCKIFTFLAHLFTDLSIWSLGFVFLSIYKSLVGKVVSERFFCFRFCSIIILVISLALVNSSDLIYVEYESVNQTLGLKQNCRVMDREVIFKRDLIDFIFYILAPISFLTFNSIQICNFVTKSRKKLKKFKIVVLSKRNQSIQKSLIKVVIGVVYFNFPVSFYMFLFNNFITQSEINIRNFYYLLLVFFFLNQFHMFGSFFLNLLHNNVFRKQFILLVKRLVKRNIFESLAVKKGVIFSEKFCIVTE